MYKYLIGVALATSFIVMPAMANGLGEDKSWQFRDANTLAAMTMLLDLQERKKGGHFEQWNTTINYDCIGKFSCGGIGRVDQLNQTTAIGNQSTTVVENNTTVQVGDNLSGTVNVVGGQVNTGHTTNQTNQDSSQAAQGNLFKGPVFGGVQNGISAGSN